MPVLRSPLRTVSLLACSLATAGMVGSGGASDAGASTGVPRPDHVVVVVMENHSDTDVIGSPAAPYINSLADSGANFTQSYAITHPSQPNYLALFSGSPQGVTDDSCPHSFDTANLGAELIDHRLSFAGYSESMPYDGYTGCSSGGYVRKHNPWVDFDNVPAASNETLQDFPSDYTQLPTVSFVIPDLDNDMHDGTVAQGDSWLRDHLDGYVQWARTHNSLLVLTFDEDDHSAGNRIPTVFAGASVRPGDYAERIDHYDVLRTLEDAYDLPHAGASAQASPITDVWAGSQSPVPPLPACTGAQLMVNSGFESGSATGWSGTPGLVVHETDTRQAAGGSWLAWLGGPGGSQSDTLSQTVSIPAGCSTATLSYYLHIDTAERYRTDDDTLTVTLRSPTGSVLTTLASYSNRDAADGYQQHRFDLSGYAGSPVAVTFSATENSTRQTDFLLDRVLVSVG